MRRSIFYIFALILNASVSASDLHKLHLLEEPNGTNLGKHCTFIFDEKNNLTTEEIRSTILAPLFSSVDRNQPGFGYTTKPVWLKCHIKNQTTSDIFFYLEIPYPMLDDIFFYEFPGSRKSWETRTGDTHPFLQRPVDYRNFLFPIAIPAEKETEILLKVSNKGALVIPLVLWSEKYLIKKISYENLLIGVFLGLSSVMLLYNMFLFIYLKEMYYLHYVLFLMGWIFLVSAITGISFQYFWQNSPWWGNYNFPIMLFFTSVWAILFSRSLLNIKEFSLVLDKILYGAVYLSAIGIAIPFILDYSISVRLGIGLALIELILIFLATVYVFFKNKQLARYALVGWALFFLSLMVYQCHSFGWLPTNWITSWAIHIGASVQIILFALALSDKLDTIREDKEKAKEEVIRMQKIAIDNIKTSQRQQEQLIAMNQELKIAREIHSSILPQFIPDVKNVRIHVSYIPMAEIGGDLYEFFNDKESNTLGIFIADVTGHGIPAALLSSIMKASLTFHKKHYTKPDKLLKEINSTIISMDNNQMVTAGYLYLDFKNKIAHYANSGHPPLLVWRKKTQTMESFYPPGKIIGWLEDSGNESLEIPFQRGDKFYLYTDGITEVRKHNNEIWGDDNFSRFLQDHASVNVDDMVVELLQTLKNFSGREEGFEDDITFIAIETD